MAMRAVHHVCWQTFDKLKYRSEKKKKCVSLCDIFIVLFALTMMQTDNFDIKDADTLFSFRFSFDFRDTKEKRLTKDC